MRVGWKLTELGEVLEILNGYAFNSKEFSDDGGMPLVRIRDLKVGVSTATKYSGDYEDKYLVHAGDLLIGMDGEFACHEWKGSDALLNQRVCRLQNFSSSVLPRFLLYGINKFLKDIENVTTFTTVKHLSARQIKSIEFPLPPLPEQKRIVSILDEAFAGIATAVANTEKNLANAGELFESYLSSVFSRQDKEWEARPLKDMVESVSTGPFGSLLHKSDYVCAGVPLVNPINIVGDRVLPDNKKMIGEDTKNRLGSYILRSGDIVIARRGEIGRCAVISETENGWLCGTGCFFIRPSREVNSDFLAHLIRSPGYRRKLERLSSGATMLNLSNKALSNLEISVPDIDTQKEVVSVISELKSQCQSVEFIYQQKLTALFELKQSLLQKAYSGDLTVEKAALTATLKEQEVA